MKFPSRIQPFVCFRVTPAADGFRVWITDFSDRRFVQSELNQDIESEFAAAGIEIPFPQTDMHLRSVDREVLSSLSDQPPPEQAP